MATLPQFPLVRYSPVFEIVLYEAYRRAQHAYPEAGQRLRKGAQLAFTGSVMLVDEKNARVLSQQGNHFYNVNGACECPDHQDRGGICKHRWAVALIRKAQCLLHHAEQESLPEGGKLCPECGMNTVETLALGYKNRNFADYAVCALRMVIGDTTYACGYRAAVE